MGAAVQALPPAPQLYLSIMATRHQNHQGAWYALDRSTLFVAGTAASRGTIDMIPVDERKDYARWIGVHCGTLALDAFELELCRCHFSPLVTCQCEEEPEWAHLPDPGPTTWRAASCGVDANGMRYIEWAAERSCSECGGTGDSTSVDVEELEFDPRCSGCGGAGVVTAGYKLSDWDGLPLPDYVDHRDGSLSRAGPGS